MKKLLLASCILALNLQANYTYEILPIDENLKQKMLKGNSHKNSCPISIKDLNYLKLAYINYEGESKIGELIVHKSISKQTAKIFEELYKIKYPIFSMNLISKYGGKDFDSIEANNTSAYNCRFVDGTKKWSNHAYGKAIDINPIENPYVSKFGEIFHKDSLKYKKRKRTNPFDISQNAMLLKNDKAVKIFKKYGWKWGGDWRTIKDYQHFEKKKK